MPYQYGLYVGEERAEKIIVSVTSYEKRFSILPLCLKSILLQSVKADRILVWLTESDFSKITKEMRKLEKYGIEYRVASDDIKPHKKYYYAMQEFPTDAVITIDDDLVYSKYMISSLIKVHKKYERAICARRVHKMQWKKNGELRPYLEWRFEVNERKGASYELLATSGAGTLFPASCLSNQAFNIDLIRKLCCDADDIWLKFMSFQKEVPVVWVPCYFSMPAVIEDSQEEALAKLNVNECKNDVYIKNLLEHFQMVGNEFKKNVS